MYFTVTSAEQAKISRRIFLGKLVQRYYFTINNENYAYYLLEYTKFIHSKCELVLAFKWQRKCVLYYIRKCNFENYFGLKYYCTCCFYKYIVLTNQVTKRLTYMTNLTNLSINSSVLNLFLFVKNSVGVVYAFLVIIIVLLQKLVYKKGTSDGFHNHPPTQIILSKIICRYNHIIQKVQFWFTSNKNVLMKIS